MRVEGKSITESIGCCGFTKIVCLLFYRNMLSFFSKTDIPLIRAVNFPHFNCSTSCNFFFPTSNDLSSTVFWRLSGELTFAHADLSTT